MNPQSRGIRSPYKNAAVSVALFAFIANPATAQTVEARCEKLLPLKALTTAAGAGFTAYDAIERKPGQLECTWLSRSSGSMKSLVVTHWNKPALGAWGREFTPVKSIDDWWDMVVTNSEDAMKGKRQAINGLGKRAALIAMPPKSGLQAKVLIQRVDDVVDVVAMGFSNPDLTKVAKALASP